MVHFSACLAVLLPFLVLVMEPALLYPDREVEFSCVFIMYCPYVFVFYSVLSSLYCGFLRITVLWGLQT